MIPNVKELGECGTCTKIPLPARDWYPKKGVDGTSNDICPGPKLGKYMRDTLCSSWMAPGGVDAPAAPVYRAAKPAAELDGTGGLLGWFESKTGLDLDDDGFEGDQPSTGR